MKVREAEESVLLQAVGPAATKKVKAWQSAGPGA